MYDNLNKSLFEPVLIFVDSLKNYILLDWQYVYKGTIRDFYPPIETLKKDSDFQIYIDSLADLEKNQIDEIISKVGKKVLPHQLPDLIDFAFLALHGKFGEDGEIQGLLETFDIPYSGSGILPSAIGMDKAFQKNLLAKSGYPTPKFVIINRKEWLSSSDIERYYKQVKDIIGDKFVIRPANQGSSIGVSILMDESIQEFQEAIDRGFFIQRITRSKWDSLSSSEKKSLIRNMVDIREGIGLPVVIGKEVIYHPDVLLSFIDSYFNEQDNTLIVQGLDRENQVIIEDFIEGKEFSCIVIKNTDNRPLALPPTEIVKGKEVFDYRSKYLAGLSRKVTPINLDDERIEAIRQACEELFNFFGFHVYARIDGFIQTDGTIYLNDPNTTSGMLPSSFFFHQAAEIGLNPSQFLTYIIRTSLDERLACINPVKTKELLNRLDSELILLKSSATDKLKVGVILGGISSERHISVESGRNIFEKLAASEKYEPVPIFLTGSLDNHELYRIPINILLKDNADDIQEKIKHFKKHPVIEKIKEEGKEITNKYVSQDVVFEPLPVSYEQLAEQVDAVFIALHGRPGEDGAVQMELEKYHVPYNGSGIQSSQLTINKYETNQLLKQHGFKVAEQSLIRREEYENDPDALTADISTKHTFPLIAKPVDEGCSSAVKKISNKEELQAYLQLTFRDQSDLVTELAKVLKLKAKEEFPVSRQVLIENFIEKGDAMYFMEVTGGMLTHYADNDAIQFEVFEPSEVLALEGVLSLEEKFLAGEGQNITPARFGKDTKEYQIIAEKVKGDLKKAAEILNVEGYCRIDAFVRVFPDLSVETIIIEINSLPGMTPATCIFHQASINGYKPYDFIDKILEFSFKKRIVESH